MFTMSPEYENKMHQNTSVEDLELKEEIK